MERSQLIEQLEKALKLAKSESNDEIEFDISDESFHIIFDEQNESFGECSLDSGEHVANIPYLAEWLGAYLDIQPRFSCGLFQAENPKETGIAYEFEEGEKLTAHLLEIAESNEMWYLSLYRDWSRNENSVFNDIFQQLGKNLGTGTIDLQVAMLRLLPFKNDEVSIESLSPPLHMAETYPEFKVAEEEGFDILDGFYTHYKEWELYQRQD